jgi:acyl dehydratase
MARDLISLEAYRGFIGRELGLSDWVLIDQARIDAFAETTEDRQFIHVDPERARQTPLGGTIAHGFLTLSLLAAMADTGLPAIEGAHMGLNYGFNRIRFLAPVPAGARVRGRFVLKDVVERSPGQWLSTVDISVEIEQGGQTALVAEWLALTIL